MAHRSQRSMICALFFALAPGAAATGQDAPAQHEFVTSNFKTESGVTLPQARVVYGTYGHLNAAGDNAVLLPSHYMANWRGYSWIIGADKALDPSKLFLVATELFGNGRSSSPSNTPEPFHGPRFPVTTIRDNVEAVHKLLTEELKITHLRAIVGFSMGAEQAFQWAVSYPTFASRIVATSGTAKCYPHGVVRLEGEIDAITSDPAFQNGDYKTPPAKGIETFGTVWLGWLYSQEWWRKELWRTGASQSMTFEQYFQNARTHFLNNADANDLILQMRTWEKHDVGTTPGFNGNVEAALKSIKVPILYMPSETDMYFPVTDARYEAAFIPGVTLMPIPSLWGHPAGAAASPADAKFLNDQISKFLGDASAGTCVDPDAMTTDFSGRWSTDPPAMAAGRGDMGSGWGSTITITQDATHLTVEYVFFGRGDMQPPLKFTYALDGSETRNSVMMGRGIQVQTSKTAWEGDKLVITTTHTFADPATGKPATEEVKQVLSLESPTSLLVETTRAGVFGGPATVTKTTYKKALGTSH